MSYSICLFCDNSLSFVFLTVDVESIDMHCFDFLSEHIYWSVYDDASSLIKIMNQATKKHETIHISG
jgi:hypothetical protein